MPFFSIIIPTLNEEQYLPRLLTGLTKQQDKDFELIIIDGGSQDKTDRVVKSFSDKLALNFFDHRAPNVATQRNFGAKKSTGKYLVFLDADITVLPSFITIAKREITKKKGLIFRPYTLPEEKRYLDLNILFTLWNKLIEILFNTNKPIGDGACMIFERNFFQLIGGFDEKVRIAEDHEIMQRSYQWGARGKLIHKLRVKFSLRRMKLEGKLTLFYKYLLIVINSLSKKQIKQIPFEYKMGGQHYQKDYQQKPKALIDYKMLATKIKELYQKLLEEV